MAEYDHKQIESKWKQKWFNSNLYEGVDFSPKPKKYILAEFPYPSGPYLHAGHMMRYTMPDIYSRFLRMQGYNVLFPMGWDNFGLPSEGYAMKVNKHPQETTKELSTGYKNAMQDMGYSFDWSRELATSDPKYYKWTQWLFLKLYEQGLAEFREMPVWWSDTLGILADEEVISDGKGGKIAERDNNPVYKKMYKQWVLRITDYAEKLLQGLEEVDYPEAIKNAQIKWIDKKEGINITYDIKDSPEKVTVFTTRPDTNFGATFIVLAPEHPLLAKITKDDFKKEVEDYIKKATGKSELERTVVEDKDKTGVFTGSYAINQLNNESIPIYVADYVLLSFGTGAVVGVPGHDKRDFEFAHKYNLPIKRVVMGVDGDNSTITDINQVQEKEGTMINSGFLDSLDIHTATIRIMDYLESKGWGKRTTNYGMRDWIFSRQHYWGDPIPLIYKENGAIEAVVPTEDIEKVNKKLPVELPYTTNYRPLADGSSPLADLKDWVATTDSQGNPAKRETQTMPTWAGSSWYYMRFTDANNPTAFADFKKMEYWLPVDKYFGGAEHTTVHLLYSRFWHRVFYDIGIVPCSEPYVWRKNGGLLMGTDGRKMSKRWGNIVEPRALVENYGADAARVALVFLGPYSDTYPWNENAMKSCWRLIKNIYELKDIVKEAGESQGKECPCKQKVMSPENIEQQAKLIKCYHQTLKKVTKMLEDMKMNTAVSEIMIFVNEARKSKCIPDTIWKGFIKLIAPLMPFLAEELWQDINHYQEWTVSNSVHSQTWPTFDPVMAQEDIIIIPIQINGKVKDQLEITVTDTEESVKEKVLELDKIKSYLVEHPLVKYIYIKNKIVNLVC